MPPHIARADIVDQDLLAYGSRATLCDLRVTKSCLFDGATFTKLAFYVTKYLQAGAKS